MLAMLLNIAENLVNIKCTFEDAYLCGYVSETFGTLTWKRVSGAGDNVKTSPTSGSSGDVSG